MGGQRHVPAGPFYPQESDPGTHYIGGWVGPRAGLDGSGKSRPHRDSIPGPSNPYRVAILTNTSSTCRKSWAGKYDQNSTIDWRKQGIKIVTFSPVARVQWRYLKLRTLRRVCAHWALALRFKIRLIPDSLPRHQICLSTRLSLSLCFTSHVAFLQSGATETHSHLELYEFISNNVTCSAIR